MGQAIREGVKKSLSKDHACYVLIACSAPDAAGHMEVEMAFDGDRDLAGYLLQSAQGYFEEEGDDALSEEAK